MREVESRGGADTRGNEILEKLLEKLIFCPIVYGNIRAVPLNLRVDAHQGRVFYCPDLTWEVGQ